MSQLQQFLTRDELPPSRHRRSGARRMVGLFSVVIFVSMIAGAFVLLRGPSDGPSIDAATTARTETRLVIPEGLRLTQTVNVSAEATGIPKIDFQLALQDSRELGLPNWANGQPEGFLYPATYEVTPSQTAQVIVGNMVKRFNQAAADTKLEAKAKARGLTPYEVVIMASLVEAEATPSDFPKVARVIYNRLNRDMKLQLDSTVNYALGTNEILLSSDQLKTSSPFNTYLVNGLPPTPINSPGEGAIRAVLNPAKGNWIYFVSVDPEAGITKFTNSYRQFLIWKQEFRQNVTK